MSEFFSKLSLSIIRRLYVDIVLTLMHNSVAMVLNFTPDPIKIKTSFSRLLNSFRADDLGLLKFMASS